ncbi:MAG: hypothetical protein K0B52_01010 [FCB group bacterium]|nr:hypothetical protein [FCB group bacterium]
MKIITLLIFPLVVSLALAFENPFVRETDYLEDPAMPLNNYVLSGNPASLVYRGNMQLYRAAGAYTDQSAYRRLFDPASVRNAEAVYTTVRSINDGSFFSTRISYEDIKQRELFSSMEKDFYDDYFSMTDSTTGNTSYYGPRLEISYNARLSEHLFFGLEAGYGVERGLQDTFPQTITIMRNSDYRIGMEYRRPAFSIGIGARYYDDQNHYEAVKKYSDVLPKTYFGYNVYYNELATATFKKRRTRNGIEYGGHIAFGKEAGVSGVFGISAIKRISRADAIRGSYTRPRGVWQREGIHLNGILNIYPESVTGMRIYGDYLRFDDWGASKISNTLILENEESYLRFGAVLVYKPSLAQQNYVAVEQRHVSYDYTEYIFPFHEQRSGWEWEYAAGTNIYLGAKTRMNFGMALEKEIPKFYWGTASFQNIKLKISLEQLFSFGYICLDMETIKKKPEESLEKVNVILFGLSFYER